MTPVLVEGVLCASQGHLASTDIHQHASIKKTSPRPLRALCEINEIPPPTAYTVAGGICGVTTPCWRHRPWQRRLPFGLLRRGSKPG